MNLRTDLNAPIDSIQADSMGQIQIIRGWVARAKETVRTWDISPMPPDWKGHD